MLSPSPRIHNPDKKFFHRLCKSGITGEAFEAVGGMKSVSFLKERLA